MAEEFTYSSQLEAFGWPLWMLGLIQHGTPYDAFVGNSIAGLHNRV